MSIQLVFCIDDKFAPYLAACLDSIKRYSTSDCAAHIVGKLNSETKAHLSALSATNLSIHFIEDVPDYSHLSISERYGSRLNQITYWRFAIAELMPDNAKVLFLDADVLVVSDISSLWHIDVSDVYAAVVSDHSLCSQKRWCDLGLDEENYFNAGMMLINLELWREDSLKEKALEIFSSRSEWEYNDQDVLNVLLSSNVRYIDAAYNTQTYTLSKNIVSQPVVVHFTGQEKPWHASSAHPFTEDFRFHLKNTPYFSTKYNLFLDEDDLHILQSLTQMLPEGGNIALWGAGMRGRRLTIAITESLKGYSISFIVDSHLSGTWRGWKIIAPEKVDFEKIDAVVIASIPFRRDILNVLGKTTVTVI